MGRRGTFYPGDRRQGHRGMTVTGNTPFCGPQTEPGPEGPRCSLGVSPVTSSPCCNTHSQMHGHTHNHVCIHTHTPQYSHLHTRTTTHTRTLTHVRTHAHTQPHTRVHTLTCARMHTHTATRTRTDDTATATPKGTTRVLARLPCGGAPPHCSVFDCPGRGGARLLRTVPFSPSLLLADPGPTSLVSQSAYESLDFG